MPLQVLRGAGVLVLVLNRKRRKVCVLVSGGFMAWHFFIFDYLGKVNWMSLG